MPTVYLRETSIATNDFGTISVPSTIYYDIGEYTTHAYADGSAINMQVLDLSSVGDEILGRVDVSEQMTYLGTYHTSEEESSIEFEAYKELVRSNLYFLWGNFDAGGMYFRRSSNKIICGIYCGLATWQEYPHENELQYLFIESNHLFSKSELAQFSISFAGDDANAQQRPSFYCYFKPDDWTNMGYWTIDTMNVQEAMYEYNSAKTIGILTQDYTWTDDFSFAWQIPPFEFEPKPCQTWGIPISSMSMNIALFTPDITGAIVIGSWDGGAIVNEPSDGGGSGVGGGDGRFPNKNTPRDFSNAEGMEHDAITSGFVTIFNPSETEMKNFNKYLFSDNITEAVSNQMKRLISNPYDYIINVAMIHFTPTRKDYKTLIKFCGFDSHVASYEVASQFQRVGPYTLEIAPQFNSFLDYNPYTKARLYLPYVGIVDLNIDDIMGSKNNNSVISLMYNIDMLSGGCIAEMKVTRGRRVAVGNADNNINNVQQSWTGNVFEKVPISANDFSSLLNATLQFASGGVSALTGNPIGGLGAMASAVMSGKGSVQKSSSNTSNYGYINNQEPMLIIESPIQSYPEYSGGFNYDSYIGIPSNIMNKVSYFKGYLETDEKTLWGTEISYEFEGTTINAFDDEIEEIKQLFESGVYVNV